MTRLRKLLITVGILAPLALLAQTTPGIEQSAESLVSSLTHDGKFWEGLLAIGAAYWANKKGQSQANETADKKLQDHKELLSTILHTVENAASLPESQVFAGVLKTVIAKEAENKGLSDLLGLMTPTNISTLKTEISKIVPDSPTPVSPLKQTS